MSADLLNDEWQLTQRRLKFTQRLVPTHSTMSADILNGEWQLTQRRLKFTQR